MIERYSERRLIKNDMDLYKKMFEDRNVSFVNHYTTPHFVYPEIFQYKNINTVKHIWKLGDRYYKLADTYYGDVKDWWVIAKFNNKPTESHISPGDTIYIPVPIHEALAVMKG